jgi:hypothetical protein
MLHHTASLISMLAYLHDSHDEVTNSLLYGKNIMIIPVEVAKAPAIPFTTVLYVPPSPLSRTWTAATVATPTMFKQMSIAATVPHANRDYFYHSKQESLHHHWQILYSNIFYIRISNQKYSGIDYEPFTIWVGGLKK